MNIIEIIRKCNSFRAGTPVTEKEILEAQNKLNLVFNEEYVQYTRALGAASYYGHELTGVSKVKYEDVVEITLTEKKCNEQVPQDFYVIECTNVDGIVYWQDRFGTIYVTQPGSKPRKVSNSLAEYIIGRE